MFTGIVEELGTVLEHDPTAGRLRLGCVTVLDDVGLGASIAVNGCCLTVVDWQVATDAVAGWWEADLTAETYARTCLGDLVAGDPVNLERPVRLDARLGGHLVQGHVDAVGTIITGGPEMEVSLPDALRRYVVEKGSITVDGVSLTVVRPTTSGFTVALIPHTAEVTTLGRKGPGARVNLEVDVMAKYAEQLLAGYLPTRKDQP